MNRAEEFLAHNPEVAGLLYDLPKEGLIAVFLYGSHATGNAGPLSDIDLCILSESNLSREEKEMLLSHASRKISLSLFEALPPAVRFRVMRDGLLLWGSPDLRVQRTRVATVRAYLNVRPLLDRHARRILG